MPPNQNLLNELMPLFRAEAKENLQTLNRYLLELEKQPDAETTRQLLAEIFRAAHTLKGSARTVGLTNLATLTHAFESLIKRMQYNQVPMGPNVFDKAYHALDTITHLVAADGIPLEVNLANECAALEGLGMASTSSASFALTEQETSSPPLPAPVDSAPTIKPPEVEPVPAPTDPTSPATSPSTDTPADETIRVTVAKLDSIFVNVGELQATRINNDQRLSETREMIQALETWQTKWLQARPLYRRLLPLIEELARDDPARSADLKYVLEFIALNENELRDTQANANVLLQHLEMDQRRVAQVATELQDNVRRMRMLPVSTVFDSFSRMVRDLARDLGKQAQLVIEGGNTELDRSMLELIKPPLLHLLRNAVDHGIESPAVREAQGKPRQGTLTLAAMQYGASIVITIQDDGAGIDPAKVKHNAINKGLVTAQAAEMMSDREVLWLIFQSGFSTRDQVTDISGRGVGMDVVRQAVEQIHGVIDLKSTVGRGTTFSLKLPLTVAAIFCLLARVGEEIFAVPLSNIERIIRMQTSQIGTAQNRPVIDYEGRPVVLVSLSDALQVQTTPRQRTEATTFRAIILALADKRAAFIVDELLGAQQVVVKNFPRPFLRVRYATGATVLGNGQAIVILYAADLLRFAYRESLVSAPPPTSAERASTRVVLIADDSITTRTLEKNILTAAGYQVRLAADGAEAWSLLQKEGIAPEGTFHLLVSDVNMPQLDGLGLTAKVRADKKLRELPVILVTSLASPQDRERGLEVGANAYITKGEFDQDTLLTIVRQLI